MNAKITKAFKTTRRFLGKHSPEILTGIGVAGMITSTVLAVKATPKALELINNEKESKAEVKTIYADNESIETKVYPTLTAWETVKTAWKPYVPALGLGIASISCIVGASAVNAKRNAALATAYAISERTLVRYRDKVIDTLGEKKDKEIREKIAQDEVNNNPVSNSQVIITSKGNTLCMDGITGRYFRSDIDTIRNIVNELNRELTYNHFVCLDDFYDKIGLKHTDNSSELGWNLDDGLIEVVFSSCISEDNEPCIVVSYTVAPRYDYYKFG